MFVVIIMPSKQIVIILVTIFEIPQDISKMYKL
jgi:hypothetical protein